MIKILLIEDDRELCRSIRRELEKNGYMVECCSGGETAMFYALNTDYGYDIAIVDRMLPVIDGLTIIRAMRQKNIQIPVIIITGMSALDDRVDGLDGGADDYLVKPFHIRELLARVRALTAKEAELLGTLMRQPEAVFSREQLVLKVWGSDSDIEPGNVDNYISFLRRRLRELGSACQIKTIYGTGYRLEESHA